MGVSASRRGAPWDGVNDGSCKQRLSIRIVRRAWTVQFARLPRLFTCCIYHRSLARVEIREMASRFGFALPSLTRLLCPQLRTAIALRVVSRSLLSAFSDGVLCTLVLSDRRLVEKSVLDSCGANLGNGGACTGGDVGIVCGAALSSRAVLCKRGGGIETNQAYIAFAVSFTL